MGRQNSGSMVVGICNGFRSEILAKCSLSEDGGVYRRLLSQRKTNSSGPQLFHCRASALY
ncbi:hypothetical protein DACRYDRAFT_19759 [Dacryopinax primogenitus]|uniref:Uncharacterized protein n=1 Tax=Dacryopinax primogenitus (strain DJM 731) TaxID=1858805 RepID=M5GGB1_DACPD|nr:uncharacterized protein DACRYDRAFT_19759 [Dacryopinax primogenitus]EJU05178.1 hypothetical protein DACRYDRAFT_19759 [Dacryopinax primogenitus]